MTTTTNAISGMRRCIGSTKFGIEAHETPVHDFPVQASAKDGLGRMCRPHWTEYTRALRKASVARKAEVESTPGSIAEVEPMPGPIAEVEAATPRKGHRAKATPEPEADAA